MKTIAEKAARQLRAPDNTAEKAAGIMIKLGDDGYVIAVSSSKDTIVTLFTDGSALTSNTAGSTNDLGVLEPRSVAAILNYAYPYQGLLECYELSKAASVKH